MSAQHQDNPTRKPALRFRGRSFLALSLAPQLPLEDWLRDLDAWLERSPGFFGGRAVILDIASASGSDPAVIGRLISDLADRGIRIMAVEGLDGASLGLGLPPVLAHGRDAQLPEESAPTSKGRTAKTPPRAEATTLFIEDPVRSGQSIFNPRGDIVVMGSVSSGAELVAGGSIHVYGALRGRAIAGIAGQPGARIFCRKFEAELLAIDGLYKSADDIDPVVHGRAVTARIVDDALVVSPLD